MKASVRSICLGVVALLALGLAPAAARATTYYARGGGGNTKASCAQGDECNLAKAVKEAEIAGPGSNVVLVPGPNFTPGEVVTVEGAIDIGGTPGAARPTIVVPSGEGAMNLRQGAHLHDANLIAGGGNYALAISESSAERVLVESTTSGTVACTFFNGTTDSTCLARESSGVFMGGSTASYTARLRNVDAIGKVYGILVFGPIAASDENLLEATNTIAVSLDFADINVNASGGGARVLLSRSDYDLTSFIGSSKNLEITPPGTNGNLTAPPLFADEAGGDLHQLPTSPTVDAGLTEDTNGTLDLDGNPRALIAHPSPCAALAGPTDIGAYELVPTVPLCPAAASSSDHGNAPPPPPALPPETTLKLAKIDSDKGTATFTFAGTGPVSGFACELVRPAPQGVKTAKRKKPKFAPCRSPKTYKHLAPGRYTFRVEALGAGGPDPTPALRKFRIRP